jgi:hypothetical protein
LREAATLFRVRETTVSIVWNYAAEQDVHKGTRVSVYVVICRL